MILIGIAIPLICIALLGLMVYSAPEVANEA
jgi:hypothetical protein